MRRFATSALLSLAVLAVLGSPQTSQATVLLVLQPSSPIGSGPFIYTYDASLSPDAQLQNGDYFAIIDFQGYVDGTVFSTNANITATSELTTVLPPNQIFPDDPTVANLLFTYTGSTPLTGPMNDLGNFGAQSIYGLISGLTFQTAADHKEAVQGSNDYSLRSGNTTQVQGPTSAVVPEPSSVTLAVIGGIFGIGYARRRSRCESN